MGKINTSRGGGNAMSSTTSMPKPSKTVTPPPAGSKGDTVGKGGKIMGSRSGKC